MPLTRLEYYNYLFQIYGLKKGTITKSWKDPSIFSNDSLSQKPVYWAYPIDFSQDVVENLLVDGADIPMINYANLGTQYNPWFIGHIALGLFSNWKNAEAEETLIKFKLLADWFLDNAVRTANGVVWLYHFDWFGGHNKPWRSGLSQAHAISTLLRAATIFEETKYEEFALMAAKEMLAPFEKGGAAYYWPDSTISIEESIIDPPSSVLNGHLFSAIACWEASRYFDDALFTNTSNALWQFVINRLHVYDLGFWSKYSLKQISKYPDIASTHYHDVHITQLKVAGVITGNSKFNEYADKFKEYQLNSIDKTKAIWLKRLVKIL